MLHSIENVTVKQGQVQQMDWIYRKYRSLEDDKPTADNVDCRERNILLLGRANSGKTTLRRMLRDPTRVSDEMSLLAKSGVRENETINYGKRALQLNIVDTKGPSGREASEDDFKNIHQSIVESGITTFHLICYCLSIEAGIRQQDITTLKNIIKFYTEGLKQHLCIIITRCESKTEEQCRRLAGEIQRDSSFHDVVTHCGQGIHFSGSLNYDDWYQGNEALCQQFLTIYNYRKKFIELACTNTNHFRMPESLTFGTSTKQPSINLEHPRIDGLKNRYVPFEPLIFFHSLMRST